MNGAETDNLRGFQRFISVRLHVLVNVNERAATLLYGRKFGINLHEWQVIAVLGEFPGRSVNDVAHLADLDKSQVSRTVSALVKRRYVSRKANDLDARSVVLDLTPSGRALFEAMCAEEGTRRQARLLSCLTDAERADLEKAVDKLIAQSRLMYEEEKAAHSASNGMKNQHEAERAP